VGSNGLTAGWAGATASIGGAIGETIISRVPHSLQNLDFGGFTTPHDGHVISLGARLAPHSLQNLLPSLLDEPHSGQ
jgi:hypothetical protein